MCASFFDGETGRHAASCVLIRCDFIVILGLISCLFILCLFLRVITLFPLELSLNWLICMFSCLFHELRWFDKNLIFLSLFCRFMRNGWKRLSSMKCKSVHVYLSIRKPKWRGTKLVGKLRGWATAPWLSFPQFPTQENRLLDEIIACTQNFYPNSFW